ncbi:FG-GAP-like repeat-containing protein [bacterium]|nr:FG-GAP-like repeat-containing protein [Verrucomicrobiales bacterium]MDC0252387.1 FG-GAP-like repeat-containing protein [bacterium]
MTRNFFLSSISYAGCVIALSFSFPLGAPAQDDKELISSQPLAETVRTAGLETLFESVSPDKSGIQHVSPIMADHPLARAYHSSSACAAVAIGDLDLDGHPDVFAGNGPLSNGLYLQKEKMKFIDATSEAGVGGGAGAWAVGISLVDIDNDGDLDIYVCNYDHPNQLFINQLIVEGKRTEGPLKFVDKAAEFGLDLTEGSVVPAFADYDRDGDLDVYILTHQIYRDKGRPQSPIQIFEEGGKFFVGDDWQRWYEVDQYRRGDNGEFLYTEAGRPDYLFRNDGNGKFTEVTLEAGITKERHWGNSATWWDYNFDGWPDLYVGNDFKSPDYLYRNNGDGTFTEAVQEHARHTTWFSMGAVQSDFNNDGYIDFLLADMMPKTHYMQMASMASMADRQDNLENVEGAEQIMHNTLHINTGTNQFLEGAWMAGIAQTEWTWAIRSADFDNDMLPDVFFCNGIPRQFNHADLPEITHASLVGKTHWDHYRNTSTRREQNLAYRNKGDFQFDDVSKEWGLDHMGMSYGASLGDLDGDGRMDLLTSNLDDPLSLYHNQSPSGNRVVVDLKGTRSNTRGIGTLVTLTTPDGVEQSRQLFPYGGFLDADEPIIHFGLGDNQKISSLRLDWPSGEVQEFKDLKVNHRHSITEPNTGAKKEPAVKSRDLRDPWFEESPVLKGFSHAELEFDDYDRQPLLPFMLSQLGPGQSWGDIDGDGDADFYLAGAAGQPGQLFRNESSPGSEEVLLSPDPQPTFQQDLRYEDMGTLFFDADSDGDLDLYVVSGGVEGPPGGDAFEDRLFWNNGKGGFTKAEKGVLPELRNSGGVVAAADFDRDGDLDLFIGSRSIPGNFPMSPQSSLLRNDGGKFTEITDSVAPTLVEAGMITSGIWTDVDNDGWIDLMVTTEWGPIKLFRNYEGKFNEETETSGLVKQGQASLGWWTGIDGGDIDNDGDIDYVATNLGRNSTYNARLDSPELIFYGDFDNSGKSHIVEARFLEENGEKICYPRRGFMASSGAMPYIADKLQTFHNYASLPLSGIYDIDRLQAAEQFVANNMDCSVLINDGKGKFTMKPLPHLAQISPGFGVALRDIDLDGLTDCYIVQNHFNITIEQGRLDGGLSTLLKGTGDSENPFELIWHHESGLVVPGDAKSLAAVDVNLDGWEDFIVGVNDEDPQIFINNLGDRSPNRPLKVRLSGTKGNPNAIGARITVTAKGLANQLSEVTAGGGYLSQSSSDQIFAVAKDNDSSVVVTVRWPDGKTSTTEADANTKFLEIDRK